MANHKTLEHVAISVDDVAATVDFCRDVLGLAIVEESADVTYFGAGFDANYDLAVRAGEPGLDHMAFRVSPDQLATLDRRLDDTDLEVTRLDGADPGQHAALRFTVPPGLPVELVVVDDARIHNFDKPRLDRAAQTPIDLDHITLGVPDVEATATVFVDTLGFANTTTKTDTGTPAGHWQSAFLRNGRGYHDIALLERSAAFVHHVAWEMTDISHMKALLDVLAQDGHRLETSIHRHDGGNNLAAYFFEPSGGHMFEITAEEETVPPGVETRYTTPAETRFSAWGGVTPARHSGRDG